MDRDRSKPTISSKLEDGTLVDLVYRPDTKATALAVSRPDGSLAIETAVETAAGDMLVPYSPGNNLIASGCVLLPSDIGDFRDKQDLLSRVQAFLHSYLDVSPEFEEIAAYYVLLSWVYDAFNDVPYLRFRGDYGTGKTRALLAVGSLCYKPFFASGASTVSPIFHIQDAFQGTLVLDEADFRFSDATSELTKVLNNGTTRGLPVLRTMTNRNRELNPTAFRVFGPKIVAMRESFSDRALESRFLTENTAAGPIRSDIPIHLPTTFAAESLALRNSLLAWRLRSVRDAKVCAPSYPPGLSNRAKQMSLSLLSLVDEDATRDRICQFLGTQEDELREDQRASAEAVMLRVLVDAFAETASPSVSVGEITRRFNAANEHLELFMSNKWVGWFVRNRLRISTMKSGGVYVVPATERAKIHASAARMGITPSPSSAL